MTFYLTVLSAFNVILGTLCLVFFIVLTFVKEDTSDDKASIRKAKDSICKYSKLSSAAKSGICDTNLLTIRKYVEKLKEHPNEEAIRLSLDVAIDEYYWSMFDNGITDDDIHALNMIVQAGKDLEGHEIARLDILRREAIDLKDSFMIYDRSLERDRNATIALGLFAFNVLMFALIQIYMQSYKYNAL